MAIIVVLAAVAVPTFGKQLETSRETGDMEIVRNAYTEALSIATLDGADGKINGIIGDGKTADADGNTTWGAVSYKSGGQYVVTLNTMNAKFSQSLTGNAWTYVNGTLMGKTVPAVNQAIATITFTFEIAANGDIQLVASNPIAVA